MLESLRTHTYILQRSLTEPVASIGIVGDVHGAEETLGHALSHLQNETCVLCTGDIVDGPGSPDTCVQLLKKHQVITVAGNHERWLLTDKHRGIAHAHQRADLSPQTLDFLRNLPRCVEIKTVSGNLLLSHGIGLNDTAQVWPGSDRLGPRKCAALDDILAEGRYRYLVHGHIHYRLVLEFERMTLINPGALKRNLQLGFKPGFMILNTGAKKLSCFHMDGAGRIVERADIDIAERNQANRVWRDTRQFDGQWDVFRIAEYMRPYQSASGNALSGEA